jgi:hypothetical protein
LRVFPDAKAIGLHMTKPCGLGTEAGMAELENGSGRVTLAVLQADLRAAVQRLEDVAKRLEKTCDQQDKDQLRMAGLETRVTVVEGRQGGLAALQAGISLVLAAMAAWWGSRP